MVKVEVIGVVDIVEVGLALRGTAVGAESI